MGKDRLHSDGKKLGVNGFGRIGKLTLWHHVGRKYFDQIIVNIGRQPGSCLEDIAHYVERDSTYGWLHGYLHGHRAEPVISDLDEENGSMVIDGVKVRFLRSQRNPAEIGWSDHGVRLVVDTTGQFLDPTLEPDQTGGALRGHLAAGAEKVIVSAPFKFKDKGTAAPEDAVTTVMGINETDYEPRRHKIISNASCTTTCLAHMMKPLVNAFGPKKIMSASMATVHAATGSQEVLDRLPKTGKVDLRKNRSILNNIILTTTGAANALRLVIPEMEEFAFIAESVRIPVQTGHFFQINRGLCRPGVGFVAFNCGGNPRNSDNIARNILFVRIVKVVMGVLCSRLFKYVIDVIPGDKWAARLFLKVNHQDDQ